MLRSVLPASQLLVQRGDSDHEELVQIRAHDGQELGPLQQLVVLVLRLLQHALLKLQQAQFAIVVERRIVQRQRRRRSSWRLGAATAAGGTTSGFAFLHPFRFDCVHGVHG